MSLTRCNVWGERAMNVQLVICSIWGSPSSAGFQLFADEGSEPLNGQCSCDDVHNVLVGHFLLLKWLFHLPLCLQTRVIDIRNTESWWVFAVCTQGRLVKYMLIDREADKMSKNGLGLWGSTPEIEENICSCVQSAFWNQVDYYDASSFRTPVWGHW